MEGNYMSNAGSITVEVDKVGVISVRETGELSHLEKIGALTMAIHTMEFSIMSGKGE
jgi:hypothetical protein